MSNQSFLRPFSITRSTNLKERKYLLESFRRDVQKHIDIAMVDYDHFDFKDLTDGDIWSRFESIKLITETLALQQSTTPVDTNYRKCNGFAAWSWQTGYELGIEFCDKIGCEMCEKAGFTVEKGKIAMKCLQPKYNKAVKSLREKNN